MEIQKDLRKLMEKSSRYPAYRAYERAVDKLNSAYGEPKKLEEVKEWESRKLPRETAKALENLLDRNNFEIENFEIETCSLGFDVRGWSDWKLELRVASSGEALSFAKKWLRDHPSSNVSECKLAIRVGEKGKMIQASDWGMSYVAGGWDYMFVRKIQKLDKFGLGRLY